VDVTKGKGHINSKGNRKQVEFKEFDGRDKEQDALLVDVHMQSNILYHGDDEDTRIFNVLRKIQKRLGPS